MPPILPGAGAGGPDKFEGPGPANETADSGFAASRAATHHGTILYIVVAKVCVRERGTLTARHLFGPVCTGQGSTASMASTASAEEYGMTEPSSRAVSGSVRFGAVFPASASTLLGQGSDISPRHTHAVRRSRAQISQVDARTRSSESVQPEQQKSTAAPETTAYVRLAKCYVKA